MLGEVFLAKENDPSQQHPTNKPFSLHMLQILHPLAMTNLDRLVDIVTYADEKFLENGHFSTDYI